MEALVVDNGIPRIYAWGVCQTANEGATFVLDYLDGSTLQIQNGSFTDIYATETSDAIELVSAGSTFKANDIEFVFTLESAGNYNINGVNVITTEDYVQV